MLLSPVFHHNSNNSSIDSLETSSAQRVFRSRRKNGTQPRAIDMTDVIRRGLLSGGQKNLPCSLFYDKRGSELFEKITELPEYYVTRAETDILQTNAASIAAALDTDVVVELGSGSSKKTELILRACLDRRAHVHYVPIDISQEFLLESSRSLRTHFADASGRLTVSPIAAEYADAVPRISKDYGGRSKTYIWLGSSIGNFTRKDASAFLANVRATLTETDALLVGIDLRKDKAVLHAAYDDSQKVTADFNLNILRRLNEELGANFELDQFEHRAVVNVLEGRVEMYLVSRRDQTVRIDGLGADVSFARGEAIHTENSYKYSLQEIATLARSAGFCVERQWLDIDCRFSLNLFRPCAPANGGTADAAAAQRMPRAGERRGAAPGTGVEEPTVPTPSDAECDALRRMLLDCWASSDRVFSLLRRPAGYYAQPIALRRPFIFYLGHLPTFGRNHIAGYLLKRPSINARFEEIFERGIDPNVDDPTACHGHPEAPEVWPAIEEVEAFRAQVRAEILASVADVLAAGRAGAFMGRGGRAIYMECEHQMMHCETLLYMYLHLDPALRSPDVAALLPPLPTVPRPAAALDDVVHVPGGRVVLGAQLDERPFMWDNECPSHEVHVEPFTIGRHPVTVGAYREFVGSGGYETERFWTAEDWRWRTTDDVRHPRSWRKTECGDWMLLLPSGEVALKCVLNWPVFVSLAEARAYACSKNCRLPTEAEIIHAAFGRPDGRQNEFPWGDARPVAGKQGNFGFARWSPDDVDAHPAGRSAFGLDDVVGNGWELTSTPLEGHPGFEAFIPGYPGYSADFFDGHHFVLVGASWATPTQLVRRSFRNFYQAHYPYVFAKFRLVSSVPKWVQAV